MGESNEGKKKPAFAVAKAGLPSL